MRMRNRCWTPCRNYVQRWPPHNNMLQCCRAHNQQHSGHSHHQPIRRHHQYMRRRHHPHTTHHLPTNSHPTSSTDVVVEGQDVAQVEERGTRIAEVERDLEHDHQRHQPQEDGRRRQQPQQQVVPAYPIRSSISTTGICVSVVGSMYPHGIPAKHAPRSAVGRAIKPVATKTTTQVSRHRDMQ